MCIFKVGSLARQFGRRSRDLESQQGLGWGDLKLFKFGPKSRQQSYIKKIPHTGNTRPSRTCVIQEYRYYTMSRQYHKSISIPWVFVNTMSPFLYHESMSKPWFHAYTMSPCLYHKSDSIPWVHVYTMSLCQIHASISIPWEIQFPDIQKYK